MGAPTLLRRLSTFDAALIVMGGIIGSGIFVTPAVVAQRAHAGTLVAAVWIFGGLIAFIGAFIFAELAWRRPEVGGLYAYMRDAFHPVVAFGYGWTALLVFQSGGMAAAAVTFANYFKPATHLAVSGTTIAVLVLVVFSLINCFGVREGSTTQNAFMLLKIGAIVFIVGAGLLLVHSAAAGAVAGPAYAGPTTKSVAPVFGFFAIFGAALIPVLFSYDGWQTASFMSGELKDPARSLSRGMVWGVLVVIALYLGMSAAMLWGLGPHGLAATSTPASDIMRLAIGPAGERIVAAIVGVSTLGFLSNQILVSPRIYHAMAYDGDFFPQLAWLHPKTRAPIVAIVLQCVVAIVITLSGRYDQILNYVTSIDYVFFALAAAALFVFRRQVAASDAGTRGLCVPGHPWSTGFFLIASVLVVVNTLAVYPVETLIGFAILLSAVPIYFAWQRFGLGREASARAVR